MLTLSPLQAAPSSRPAFTLVELLIVIVVIAILAAISIVAYVGIQDEANSSAIKADMGNNARKIEQYKVLNSGNAPMNGTQFSSAGLSFSRDSYTVLFYCAAGPDFSLGASTPGNTNIVYSSKSGLQEKAWTKSASAACSSMGLTSATVGAWVLPGPSGWNTNWAP